MMILPKRSKKTSQVKFPFSLKTNESGQILIVFLLVLVVGLAIALSIASRTINDIRQTTTSDDSNKAYFAAEAGIETALKKIEGGTTSGSFSVDFSSTSNSSGNAVIGSLCDPTTGCQVYQVPDLQAKDDVSQVSLSKAFNATNPVDATNKYFLYNDGLNIYWGDTAFGPKPAIEVSVIGATADLGTWTMAKYAFDPVSQGNGFCTFGVNLGTPVLLTSELSSNPLPYAYKAQITAFNASPPAGCNNDRFDPSGTGFIPVLARIRMLYNTTSVPVAVVGCTSGGCAGGDPPITNVKPLLSQGQVVTSVGTTTSGVQRKLQIYRTFPSLPPIFDYVLFNGSTSVPLQK